VLSPYFAADASKLVAAVLMQGLGDGGTATLTYSQESAVLPTVEELRARVYIQLSRNRAYALRMTRRLCRCCHRSVEFYLEECGFISTERRATFRRSMWMVRSTGL
jgi:hypothetical protein